ncbi:MULTISPECIES: MOSC domain-containing protein [Flavobacteriaceae]|uniref:MOSC domain-containing protein n=1 Tax=Flavobacteriaceae TaxID=49546 RepID=UPI0014916BB0|nr:MULTISPECIES: MOSC domain-containing protein [Allomuricauda]MDC6367742.1 MOSC domain-containing protein [Muricauda sp. AC10]
MEVISTNIAIPKNVQWNGKNIITGIFKYPVPEPIVLESESVAKDTIADRKVHGGIYKACYLFSSNYYPYWKEKYPDLDWNWGMFGENLTIKNLDESKLRIGNIYRLGTSLVQISQPREPCFKLGIRFGTQDILKEFIDHGYPGTYVKVLEIGEVKTGDRMVLVEESENSLTTRQFYQLLYTKTKDISVIQLAIENEALPEYKRERLKKYL